MRGDIDQTAHLSAIRAVLAAVGSEARPDYVLKGGTALYLCHGLDRFSEGIDFDAVRSDVDHDVLLSAIDRVCKERGWSARCAKDTATTQRLFLDYGSAGTPLKVEASCRNAAVRPDLYETRAGTWVYTLDALARMKAAAYMSRDRIRDLYDVSWLCSERISDLSETSVDALRRALEYKDLEQFDYLMRTQDDPLVDAALLEDRFLRSFSALGLLRDDASRDR